MMDLEDRRRPSRKHHPLHVEWQPPELLNASARNQRSHDIFGDSMTYAKEQPERSQRIPRLFLRVKHPSADPARISGIFAIDPVHAVARGESRNSSGQLRVHSESYWLADLSHPSQTPSAETIDNYRRVFASASVEDSRAAAEKIFPTYGNFLSGLPKDELLAMSGASMLELLLLKQLRKLKTQHLAYMPLIEEGGSIALIVQLPIQAESARPGIRIRPSLARTLAELSLELEIDWGE